MRPRRRLAVVLVLGLLALGCEARRHHDAAPHAAGVGAPGIVVLCLDTLRFDAPFSHALPARSGDVATPRMPALAAFAADATRFPDASTCAPWTAPAIATVLTGIDPPRHGVRGPRDAPPLAASVRTLPERLQAAGFDTAAISGDSWVSPAQGFGQGFHRFETTFDVNGARPSIAAWDAKRDRAKPFFLFLHTYAAHNPYGQKGAAAPPPDVERFTGLAREAESAFAAALASLTPHARVLPADTLARMGEAFATDALATEAWQRSTPLALRAAVGEQSRAWADGDWRDGPEPAAVAARIRAAYERALSGVDVVVRDVLAGLAAAHLPEDTVVLVFADHGEAFGEHGFIGHGADLHDEVLRVPLFLRAPGRLQDGDVRGSCGLVDVAPTLLELAGLERPADLDGRSLVRLAQGTSAPHPIAAFSDAYASVRGFTTRVTSVSVRTEAYKVVLSAVAATGEVVSEVAYDLANDPEERRPLALPAIGDAGPGLARAVAAARATLPRNGP